jgi:hypothetical protein
VLAALVAAAALSLPPLPHAWPHTFQIGLAQSPGDERGSFGFRYQYLAGGVNTGHGWSTWNPDGTFASMYVRDSWKHAKIPVLSYYMLLQSKPGGGDELHADLANLESPTTMAAYWRDVRLLFTRITGDRPVVVHVEPDLWGYLEQANATALASRFAQQWVRLRNELAPNAILAYHMSGWGTKHDIVYEDPPDATVERYAAQSAAFYRSLDARFDVSFEDFSDRDAGWYAAQGNSSTWFAPADFHRHLLYAQTFVRLSGVRMVAWQIPLGNADTRYKDDRVEWLLGSRAHLQAYAKAGVVAFLFGAGADGQTTADTDGGLFRRLAARYYAAGPVPLR